MVSEYLDQDFTWPGQGFLADNVLLTMCCKMSHTEKEKQILRNHVSIAKMCFKIPHKYNNHIL